MMRCGKHKGETYEQIAVADRGYCAWVLKEGCSWNAFEDFAAYLRSEQGGVLQIGQHKGSFFKELWENHIDYCYWTASLEEPSQPMEAFVQYVQRRMRADKSSQEDASASTSASKKQRRSKQDPPHSFECKICYNAIVHSVLIPCGHMLCDRCASNFENGKCPFCRDHVGQVVRTFM